MVCCGSVAGVGNSGCGDGGVLRVQGRLKGRLGDCGCEVKALDDRLVMYLFASMALSAFLLVDFMNLFLLLMRFVHILNLCNLSGLFLVFLGLAFFAVLSELVLFGAAFSAACPLSENSGWSPSAVGADEAGHR